MSVLIDSPLSLVIAIFVSASVSVMPAEQPRFEDIETTAYGFTIVAALAYIDSLASHGVIEHHIAAGLSARIMNRPGRWDQWGEQAGKAFKSALAAYKAVGFSTITDSLSYCSLLLDYAYYSARAASADTAKTGVHKTAELWALKEALGMAVSEWQKERATMELARYYSSGNNPDSLVNGLFERVVTHSNNTDALGPAYWHWIDWFIARGRSDSAQSQLQKMINALRGTKWEPRAHGLIELLRRTELFVESVGFVDSTMYIITSFRNVVGDVTLFMCPVSLERWLNSGRVRLFKDVHGCSGVREYTEIVSADMNGEILTWRIPLPPPGLYEMALSYGDTSIAHALGVFNVRLSPKRGKESTAITDIPSDADISAYVMYPVGGWVSVTDISRTDTVVHIPLGTGEPLQVIVSGEGMAGWWGPSGTGPAFQLIYRSP